MAQLIQVAAWALAVCGATYGVTISIYALPLRLLAHRGAMSEARWLRTASTLALMLLYCPACVGFWCGIGLSAIGLNPLYGSDGLAGVALAGLGASAVGALWRHVQEDPAIAREAGLMQAESGKRAPEERLADQEHA